jgi:hypothetical protein
VFLAQERRRLLSLQIRSEKWLDLRLRRKDIDEKGWHLRIGLHGPVNVNDKRSLQQEVHKDRCIELLGRHNVYKGASNRCLIIH